jgi:hypothetical protein
MRKGLAAPRFGDLTCFSPSLAQGFRNIFRGSLVGWPIAEADVINPTVFLP